MACILVKKDADNRTNAVLILDVQSRKPYYGDPPPQTHSTDIDLINNENKYYASFVVLALSILPCAMAQQMEVAFSLQGRNITWFSVDDPSTQGSLSFTGLSGSFEGNALVYDSVAIGYSSSMAHPLTITRCGHLV